MKTQVSILLKHNIFVSSYFKTKVSLYIDGNKNSPIKIKSGRKPYLIELSPGTHVVYFKVHNGLAMIGSKLVFGAFGAGIGAGTGIGGLSTFGALEGADMAPLAIGASRASDNILECSLIEGDTLRISVSPKMSGKAKIKILQ